MNNTTKWVNRMPKFYWLLKIFFPAISPEKVAIAFADKVYSLFVISPDLWEHETTHSRQQRYSSFWGTIWWTRYIFSRKFRYSQEIEAYRNQYRYIRENCQREVVFKLLNKLASDLSGDIYGQLVPFSQALGEIQK